MKNYHIWVSNILNLEIPHHHLQLGQRNHKKKSNYDPIYGVFNENIEQEEQEKGIRILKGQTFVPASQSKPMDLDEEDELDVRPSLGKRKVNDKNKREFEQQPTEFVSKKSKAGKTPAPSIPVDKEFAKFEQYTKGIGSKLMAKMGYVPGKGLGKDGSGISAPIDVKLRPQKMGLGHGGFDEKTETIKREKQAQIKQEEQEEPQLSSRWKKSKKKKPSYKTAQQLLAEQMDQEGISVSKKTIVIDMTGKETRVLEDISKLQPTLVNRLPELRHNLGILADAHQSLLTRDIKSLKEHQLKLDIALQDQIHYQNKSILDSKQLQDFQKLFQVICTIKQSMQDLLHETNITWESLQDHFDSEFSILESEFYTQVLELHLDQLIVGAITPGIKSILSTWNILDHPTLGASTLHKWIRILDFSIQENQENSKKQSQSVMSAYECLLYTVWLPKLRQYIK